MSDRAHMGGGPAARDHGAMHEIAADPTTAVTRLLLLADEPRRAAASARERAETRVRRYRLARLRLDPGASRDARHAHLRASHD